MAKLKQQDVESGFELLRKFAKIVDLAGNWANITVGGVHEFHGSQSPDLKSMQLRICQQQGNGTMRRVSLKLWDWLGHICINSRVLLARHEPSIGINIRNTPSAIRKEGIVGSITVLLLWPAEPHLEHFPPNGARSLRGNSYWVKERVVEIAKAIDDEDGLIGALNAFHRHFPHSKSEDKPE
ncbi:hypothetical protein L3X38_008791 [Prunus dulcis]|uniref:Uncharacterized protein n=1 Tax=Prunus dulcis TaxID=3755 RepID=A0AAD4ZXJ5_PRUDU|nr:hypothetical protein L3X38_008791 [Prunus dulcis]